MNHEFREGEIFNFFFSVIAISILESFSGEAVSACKIVVVNQPILLERSKQKRYLYLVYTNIKIKSTRREEHSFQKEFHTNIRTAKAYGDNNTKTSEKHKE